MWFVVNRAAYGESLRLLHGKNLCIMKIRLLIFISLAIFPTILYAGAVRVGRVFYILNEDGTAEVTVSNNSGLEEWYSESIEIPESINYDGMNYTVTSIGAGAFWDCENLRTITIANSVTTIKSRAFNSCI